MVPQTFCRARAVTAALFLLVVLILSMKIKAPFLAYDEGFAVFNAVRVMEGDVPHRDFWAIYPPGQSYALAAMFKLFGTTLFVARVYDSIVRMVIVVGVYLIARRITSRGLGLVACMATAILLGSVGFHSYALFPSLALGLLSLVSVLEFLRRRRSIWLLLAGALAGLASLFRLDIGLYAVISVAGTAFGCGLGRRAQGGRSSSGGLSVAFKMVMLVLVGMLAVALPGYCHFARGGGFGQLYEQLLVFPTTQLHAIRWLPYPGLVPPLLPVSFSASALKSAYSGFLNWTRFYFPVIALGIASLYYGNSLLRRRGLSKTKCLSVLCVVVFGGLLFAQALSRYDYVHVVPSSILASLVICSLAHDCSLSSRSRLRKIVASSLLVVFASLYFLAPIRELCVSARHTPPLGRHSSLRRAGGVLLKSDQEQAVEYVVAHTREGEAIFVGNSRHDRIFTSDVGFYFLSGRCSPTRFHELFPGVATTLLAQKEIVGDIESVGVRYVVLVDSRQSKEPNSSAVSSGVYHLDEFIQSHYAPVARFGKYEIRKRPGC